MKVDYHLHLEEGPYSIRWLAKINEALECYEPLQERHSIDWLMKTQERLQKRVKEGTIYKRMDGSLFRRSCAKRNKRSGNC